MGYSDILNLHLFCRRAGLSTFYGPNLLSPLADPQGLHPDTVRWFRRTLMEGVRGPVEVPGSWTCRPPIYENPEDVRPYAPCPGYELIQGEGRAEGVLLGGHTGLMELDGTPFGTEGGGLDRRDPLPRGYPSFFSPGQLDAFLDWLGKSGALERLRGIVIGRIGEKRGFEEHAARIRRTVGEEYGRPHLPVLYGLPFGHISPQCPMPYMAYRPGSTATPGRSRFWRQGCCKPPSTAGGAGPEPAPRKQGGPAAPHGARMGSPLRFWAEPAPYSMEMK